MAPCCARLNFLSIIYQIEVETKRERKSFELNSSNFASLNSHCVSLCDSLSTVKNRSKPLNCAATFVPASTDTLRKLAIKVDDRQKSESIRRIRSGWSCNSAEARQKREESLSNGRSDSSAIRTRINCDRFPMIYSAMASCATPNLQLL